MSTETFQTLSQLAIALGLALAAIGGFGAYHFGQKAQKEKDAKSTYSGVLKPARKVLLSAQTKVFPEMEFGDSGTVFVFAGPQGMPLLKFAEDNHLTITTDKDGIKVSTIIRDIRGKVVAELIENEWKVNPNDSWDRNYSRNALEVKDDRGDVVLQARLVENRVQLQAKFYDSAGNGIGIGKGLGPEGGGIMQMGSSEHPLTMRIEPLFKYPSDLHLGELR